MSAAVYRADSALQGAEHNPMCRFLVGHYALTRGQLADVELTSQMQFKLILHLAEHCSAPAEQRGNKYSHLMHLMYMDHSDLYAAENHTMEDYLQCSAGYALSDIVAVMACSYKPAHSLCAQPGARARNLVLVRA
jgi:hypothetical protein